MTIVLPISPILLHLGPTVKCLYLCLRCLGTFWQCQNLRQMAAILNFKMAAICFTLHYISLTIALWKANKDSLYLGKCVLYVEIVIIRPPYRNSRWPPHYYTCSFPWQIDVAYLVSCHWESCYLSISFRWQPYSISRWRLHCRSFSVLLSIPRYMSTYHRASRLLIVGPTVSHHIC